jgi:hypothetical protein
MDAVWSRLAARQHLVVALLSAWLILTSPWVHMLRRIPRDAGFLNYSHVVLGFLVLLLATAYTASCTRAGRWRLYFPWLAGRLGRPLEELRGLLRGRIPTAEGGGLFALVEGLLLLLLLVTALSGAAWYWTQGSSEALGWRDCHLCAARGMMVLLALHIVFAALHFRELIGE